MSGMKVTPQQLKEWRDKGLKTIDRNMYDISAKVFFANNKPVYDHLVELGKMTEKEREKAGVINFKKPKMNKTESAYAMILEARKRAGEILHYGFEEVTLKIGNDTRYTPDFFVVKRGRDYGHDDYTVIEFIETKGGFIRDDSRVKFQCARKQFPFFKFTMMQLVKGSWTEIYPE